MKRFISLIIVAVICAGLIPAAFAQESTRSEELSALEARAEAGDAEAMCALGKEIYFMQDADTEDFALAWEWFKRAEEQGYPEAYYWLGHMCDYCFSPEVDVFADNGLEKALEMAMEYYQKGIDLENADCMTAMGGLLSYSPLAEQDEAMAKSLFERAAALGDPDGMACLGLMYHYGNSVTPQDYGKALELYEKAGDMGLISALEVLSDMYYEGEGVPKDMEKYTEYYERARKLKGEESERERQASIYFKGQ